MKAIKACVFVFLFACLLAGMLFPAQQSDVNDEEYSREEACFRAEGFVNVFNWKWNNGDEYIGYVPWEYDCQHPDKYSQYGDVHIACIIHEFSKTPFPARKASRLGPARRFC